MSNYRSVIFAVLLLVASSFTQDTANQTDTQPIPVPVTTYTAFVLGPQDSQTITFYTGAIHDGHFIEVKKGDKVIFSVTAEGKSEHTEEYKPDAVATQFWVDLVMAFPAACKVNSETKP